MSKKQKADHGPQEPESAEVDSIANEAPVDGEPAAEAEPSLSNEEELARERDDPVISRLVSRRRRRCRRRA